MDQILAVQPTVPSQLGPDVSELPLHDITLWQQGTILSAHVFPRPLSLDRLGSALAEIARVYPVVAGRFRRTATEAGDFEYFIELTNSPINVVIATSTSPPPFDTSAVIQPSLHSFVTSLDPATQLSDPDSPLLSVKVTQFPETETSVLGLCWAHVLGDGAAFATFTRILSQLYEGVPVDEADYPTFEPHVDLFAGTDEMLAKWQDVSPSFELAEAYALYTKAHVESELVQVEFTSEELQLLKGLGRGPGEDEWISEQDALSSYWINLLRLSGNPIDSVTTSINYRTLFPSHPSFPPNLPTLCANVAQMLATPLPPPSTQLSLRPVALAIRKSLRDLRADPEEAREWLSCRAKGIRETCDAGTMQCLVPREGSCFVNSNGRYDWNLSFGFPTGSTQFHTSFSTLNFLRVFRTNDGKGVECTWRMKTGLAEKALKELERDRAEGWTRWQ